ncbi:MAG: methyltransferase [Saprospiraceae bacterium]|nr:carboxymuconolactone decarboxylase family protein [Saprospiraceae bacterium]MDW8228400.1 methyltransferase [Saprospiraceae bacterium]
MPPLLSPLPPGYNAEVAHMAAFFNETLGFCPNSVLTLQRRPAIAKAFIALNRAVMTNEGRVSSAFKRLIGYVASHAAGCQYCQAHTIRAAERYGAAPEQLAHVWEYRTHPAFNDAERAALDFAIAAASVPNAVTETIEQNLRRYWDEGEIVEILAVVALFGFLNRWNDSMGTPLEAPALKTANRYLAARGWTGGKHVQTTPAPANETPPPETPIRTWRDVAFVAVQAVLMGAYLANPEALQISIPEAVRHLGLLLAVGGAGILTWAFVNLGRSLTAFPTPKVEGQLVTTGIYRWARHPIYSGVLMIALGWAAFSQSGWRLVLFAALTALFWAKSSYEEHLLARRYPEYAEYRRRVGRFGPKWHW